MLLVFSVLCLLYTSESVPAWRLYVILWSFDMFVSACDCVSLCSDVCLRVWMVLISLCVTGNTTGFLSLEKLLHNVYWTAQKASHTGRNGLLYKILNQVLQGIKWLNQIDSDWSRQETTLFIKEHPWIVIFKLYDRF